MQLRAGQILGLATLPLESSDSISSMATDGARILYNPSFCLQAIRNVCSSQTSTGECANALLLAMLAHELYHAHHHMLRKPGPDLELEADQAAGFVLGRAGVSAEHFLEVLRSFVETREHPAAAVRERAVRRGYARGQAELILAARR